MSKNWYIDVAHYRLQELTKGGDNRYLLCPSLDFNSIGNLDKYKPAKIPCTHNRNSTHYSLRNVKISVCLGILEALLEYDRQLIEGAKSKAFSLTDFTAGFIVWYEVEFAQPIRNDLCLEFKFDMCLTRITNRFKKSDKSNGQPPYLIF